MKQNPTAGVHTFCDRQKPLPDGAAQYYVAGMISVADAQALAHSFNAFVKIPLHPGDVQGNPKLCILRN